MRYALIALTLGVVGCGAGPNPAAPDEEPGTARVEIVTAMPSAQTEDHRSTGVVDFANDRSEYVDEQTGCRSISIGGVSYSEQPADESVRGRRWLRSGAVDTEELFEQSLEPTTSDDGRNASVHVFFGATPGPYPDGYVEHLRAISGAEPKPLGRDDVSGVPTTRYRVRLDVKEKQRRELEAAGWGAANIDRYLESVVGGTEEIEVWIGADGLARKVVSRTTWAEDTTWAEEELFGPAVTTTEYFDFGVQADIQAPPAEDVLDELEWWRITRELQEKELEELLEERESEDEKSSAEEERPPSCLH